MTFTVVPETFSMVKYEADEIADLAASVASLVGLPADLDIRIEVDESTPLGRAWVTDYGDPVVLALESGALEEPKKPRTLAPSGAANILGLLLYRVRDRRDPAFYAGGEPPADRELSLAQAVAWDVYCIGRLVRGGQRHYNDRQRRLYHFRNRHGFSDAADAAFEHLWTADRLTWADIDRVSAEALAAA